MSVVFLTTGGRRDTILRDAIAGKGYVIDAERSAYGCPEVCTWGIQDPPCIVKVHDGRAVHQISDPADIKAWTYVKGLHTQAVNAYEAAKAAAQEPVE